VLEADVVEYKVVIPSAKRKRDDPGDSVTKKPKMNSDLSDDLRCGICIDVIYQCVTLMPCLHNVSCTQFCGGCFSDWLERSKLCPACRDPVHEVKRNSSLSNIIENYLKTHPEECRPQEELKELELKNKITQDSLTISARKKSFDSSGSASESSEEEVKLPRRGRPARVTNRVRCRQCARSVQGYKCTATQAHIVCSQCQAPMPQRPGVPQTCEGCQRHFCNQYWRTNPRCTFGVRPRQLMQLESYRGTTFTSLPPSSLNENQFEQNVLLDFLRSHSLTFNHVVEAALADITANSWTPRLCED
jgi:E3 ubiquitin-protein ligase CHFR